jgi:beta-glucosidase
LCLEGSYQERTRRYTASEAEIAAYADSSDSPPFVDTERIAFLRDHLTMAAEAIRRGVPLRGYFVWSLLDNFEWAHGYGQRFGVVHVDYDTMERTMRSSAEWYRDLIRSRVIT